MLTMAIQSAGLLLYRERPFGPQVFLVHMGGPIWAGKDAAAWSIPKGLVGFGETPLDAAVREFEEETGLAITGKYEPLGTFRQNSRKDLTVWALAGDCDPTRMVSNTFSMVRPPKSGKTQTFPEADRAAWLDQEDAFARIVKGQHAVLEAFYLERTICWSLSLPA